MATSTAERIAIDMSDLSLPEQLWLMERLARQIRHHALPDTHEAQDLLERQLATMASDPDIQRELCDIEAEFAVTEADGLGSDR